MTENFNEKLKSFCDHMAELETMTKQFSDNHFQLVNQATSKENVWNKLDSSVTYVFANTAYYWLYLLLKRTDTKDHPIGNELTRVRKYMEEFEMLKKTAPKVNLRVANNLIKSGLYEPNNPERNQAFKDKSRSFHHPNHHHNNRKNKKHRQNWNKYHFYY